MDCTINVFEKIACEPASRRIIAFCFPLTSEEDINGSVKHLDEKFLDKKLFLFKEVKKYVKCYFETQAYRSKSFNGSNYIISFKVFFSNSDDLVSFKEDTLKYFKKVLSKK